MSLRDNALIIRLESKLGAAISAGTASVAAAGAGVAEDGSAMFYPFIDQRYSFVWRHFVFKLLGALRLRLAMGLRVLQYCIA